MVDGVTDVDKIIDKQLGVKEKSSAPRTSFKVLGDSKIPVSSNRGGMWKARKDATVRNLQPYFEAARLARRYYRNSQSRHNSEHGHHNHGSDSGQRHNNGSQGINDEWTETENIIFANVRIIAPIIYSRDPTIEISFQHRDEELEDIGRVTVTMLERLMNKLLSKRIRPGVNMKPKARKAIVEAQLSNGAWAVIDWTKKVDSSETALKDLEGIAEEMANKKTTQKRLRELEGELIVLEKKINILEPEGPSVKIKSLEQVIMDPSSTDLDPIPDAGWGMVQEFIPTEELNAEYGTRTENGKEVKSIYEPTHILKSSVAGDSNSVQDEIDNFNIFQTGEDFKKHGFKDEATFNASKHTSVWVVMDKATRRFEMYASNNWKWPIWVWDDPFGLEEFFNVYKLQFDVDPEFSNMKSETVYILDQQDAINDINSDEAKARDWARKNVFFDKNSIKKADVEAVLFGPDGTARGIDVPDGKTMADVIFSIPPPNLSFPELFDKQSKYAAIDRIQTVNEIIRGGQFKTNTTNDQSQFIVDNASIQIENKTDIVEDWVGKISFGLLQLCVKNMSTEMVSKLIGPKSAKLWESYKQQGVDIRDLYSMRVVGGSTTKPTSRAKKQEALQMTQTMGQFAGAAPEITVIMLKILERAFDEVTLTEEDITGVRQSIELQLQRGSSAPGERGQGGGQQGGGQDPEAIKQAAIEEAINRGVPPETAEQLVTEQLNQGA